MRYVTYEDDAIQFLDMLARKVGAMHVGATCGFPQLLDENYMHIEWLRASPSIAWYPTKPIECIQLLNIFLDLAFEGHDIITSSNKVFMKRGTTLDTLVVMRDLENA